MLMPGRDVTGWEGMEWDRIMCHLTASDGFVSCFASRFNGDLYHITA